MRLIKLGSESTKPAYDTILELGCGPNFLLNRVELFETMIKEQGNTFWFRFWLSICLNPSCDDLSAVQRQWPEMSAYVNRGVHKLFLSGSHQKTCQYCLDIIKLLSVSSPTNKPSHVLVKKAIRKNKQRNVLVKVVLQELLIKCFQMEYSCALCVLFYEWLGVGATLIDENNTKGITYWTVPERYLVPDFQPGSLEVFLANEWKDKLATLLGVTYNQAPWLKKLIKERSQLLCEVQNKLELDSKLFSLETVTQVEVLLSIRRNECRKAIKKSDEIPNVVHLNSSEKISLQRKQSTRIKSKLVKENLTKDSLKPSGRACAFCGTEISNKIQYSKYNRCLNENWLEQRYYCGNTCKVEHWFQEHYNEYCGDKTIKKKGKLTPNTFVRSLCSTRT